MTVQLLSKDERRAGYRVKFNVNSLLRGDTATRFAAYAQGRQNGWLSANDVRELEDMNPLEGSQGDIYYMPLNMIPADQAANGMPTASTEETPDDEALNEDRSIGKPKVAESRAALELRQKRSANSRRRLQQVWLRLFLQSADRIVGRELVALRRILKRAFGDNGNGIAQFEEEAREFFDDFPDFVRKEVSPLLASYTEALRAEVELEIGDLPEGSLETWSDGYADRWGRHHVETSKGHIAKIIADTDSDEVESALSERFDNWSEKRPEKIATKESVRVSGAFVVAAFVAGGVTRMTWHSFGDSCPYCTKLHGMTVEVHESFAKAGDTIDPEDPEVEPLKINHIMNHPPSHGGCDCGIVAG